MNIALIGYGKMGKEIEQIALQRGHSITLKITEENQEALTGEELKNAGVAIEFTRPDAAFEHVTACFNAGIPVVCGTTGWNDQQEEATKICREKKGAFLLSSNFSIGVNLFFELNKKLAELMNTHPEYETDVEEIHHLEKKDAPSGTAITIAEQIIDQLDRKKTWKLDGVEPTELGIKALRIDGVPGTHRVRYNSSIDDLELIHTAHNRKGFALGAVLAAEFLFQKKGVFSMADVLGITSQPTN